MTQKSFTSAVTILGFAALAACSQSKAAVTDSSAGTLADSKAPATLNPGRQISMATTEAISSRTARPGDAFTAAVVADVRDEGDRVAIPEGSLVYGTITDVQSASNPRSSGTLTLVVNSMTVHGRNYPIEASIDSLATERAGRPISGSDAVKVGVGAAAGAIVGQVITKDTRGTIIGAAVGGAVGAGVAAATKDSDIRVPAGTHVIITLTQRLTITGN